MKMVRYGLMVAMLLSGSLSVLWAQTSPLVIGLTQSLTGSLSPGQKQFMEGEFPGMVKEFTGLSAVVRHGDDYDTLAKKLEAGQIQLALFTGIEYAWISRRFENLKPLLITTYKKAAVRALLITKKDAPAAFADLQGKDIGWHKQSRQQCQLYLERLCRDVDSTPESFFKKIEAPKSGETALDDVILGKIAACVVDEVAWNLYKSVKPGGYKRLKVLSQSEEFPPPVFAYHAGSLSDKTLSQFRTGMFKANNSSKGQDVMAMFKISAFENPPSQYPAMLESIVKVYPEMAAK